MTISAKCSETWQQRGTMLSGTLYRPRSSEPRTSGVVYGYLPTPVAYDATPGGPNNHYEGLGNIAAHGKTWPTPNSIDSSMSKTKLTTTLRWQEEDRQLHLSHAVKIDELGMWPTPRASDDRPQWKTVEDMEESGYGAMLASAVALKEEMERKRREEARPVGFGLAFESSTGGRKTLPTPTASMGDGGGKVNRSNHATIKGISEACPDARGGELNPDWVEWLMGWPIGWTACTRLETVRWRSWLRQHSFALLRELALT